jgi:hypothetical protein
MKNYLLKTKKALWIIPFIMMWMFSSGGDLSAQWAGQGNESGVLNISVYDWAGANVMSVASGMPVSDNYNYVFPINIGNLSSGRYNCVISINDNKFVKYFIINK